jgi:hypothetical protein
MTVADLRLPLVAFLRADPAISAAVGGDRVSPLVLDQGDRGPSIVYTCVSAVGDHHMQGASGLAMARMQLDAWAETPDAADTLARLVKTRLDGYRGPMGFAGSPPGPGVQVQGVFFDNIREDYEAALQLYRVSADYLVWYEER